MFPNLVEDTKEYWCKLNELEVAYQKGEVSIEEVDGRVKLLMTELGKSRQAALNYVLNSFYHFLNEQGEAIVGIAILGVISYAWVVLS
ncbi:hypothetical protein CDG77_22525 [Nostoc sp. 'Peltigera membranacea cyanobiont' 213]|uniref:hypothetical protein n=1 Tax=unclassified Nostoc TaxID=2593658 RepID=UPI000B95141E|nr:MULTISPECIES: hypothetical protein [unclassified Nostoc]OYD88641.1 hypothetical protein CDG77_22525 [Nostoc sp. 'Peltigera membranacea cyanobiont' 213]QHG20490.1 hypothetical protein GJB62_31710 [Nostoc sp. ATCC 53789]RCJ19245.1 hypothetical protein A6V25_27210 [Nostoc sp. ATCC 53789]